MIRVSLLARLLVVSSLLVAAVRAEEDPLPIPSGQYKRIHQNWLADIVKGKADKVVQEVRDSLAKHPDPESYYMLAVALSAQDDQDEAMQAVRDALNAGLPPARFFTGRQQGLDTVAKTEAFRKLREEHRGNLKPTVMLGRMTSDSVTFWLRVTPGDSVRIDVISSNRDRHESSWVTADPEQDDVIEVMINGLKPSTKYVYGVRRKWERATILQEGKSFKTFPPNGQPGKFKLAFGGGAGYVPPKERMWTTIAKTQPDALLLLGDNVYSDAPQMPEMQWYCYYRRQARPEFRFLVTHTPVYTIWDDHDFATNDSHGGPEIDKPAWKRDVWKVYKNNWVNPGYGGGDEHPGCYYKFAIGDVEFFMLDGRYYRTSPKLPEEERSMLGPVQEKWLLDALADSKATFKVICSPVPWTYEAKGDSPDTWNGYKAQRTRIFDFLTDNKVEGVVLMSADRHRSDLWKIDREGAYPLYEFNSSKLTNQHTHPEMKEAEFSFNGNSFGLVYFDTTADDPQVRYEIIDIDGKRVFEFDLPLSKLK